jgi:hypothetical protein
MTKTGKLFWSFLGYFVIPAKAGIYEALSGYPLSRV